MRFSSRLPWPAAACAVLLLTLMSPVPLAAQAMPGEEPPPDPGLQVAHRFVGLFLEADYERARKMMDARMREAMTPKEAQRFAEMVEAQAGQPGPMGDPSLRATTGVYRHFIVPVEYEQREVRFRVVLDGQEQVAGFYLMPSEDEEETDQSGGGAARGEPGEAPADPADGGSEPEEKPAPPPPSVRPGDTPSS